MDEKIERIVFTLGERKIEVTEEEAVTLLFMLERLFDTRPKVWLDSTIQT